ncbi:tetracycline regulation of excision RteC [Flavobacterium sp. NST-5]|uniref:Tetracycline regulation of excision RteC n=1 Tax=Flavobacterium ichthyis TaxID=2698827 RepID=A0ABW9ZB14_9FLAO|nr:RteC domain-containing protein [Flavobacterium ichthyis]NBL66115.1 tetracycline regulation of excision RteC [Flavobacterium ichthyis]
MNTKILTLLIGLNEQLNFIDLEVDNQMMKYEKAIKVILVSIANLKKLITKSSFKTDTEEIDFFKDIKPQFTSKLIYYNLVYKFEMKRPNGGNRILKKFYNIELQKLKAFF